MIYFGIPILLISRQNTSAFLSQQIYQARFFLTLIKHARFRKNLYSHQDQLPFQISRN